MQIVVLAGGLSTERDVSLSTGTMVSRALQSKGHQVILLDVFIGYGKEGDCLDGVFQEPGELSAQAGKIEETVPDIAKIKAMRSDPDCFFGPNVIRLCRMADIVFMALHGDDGENGKVQAVFDLFGIHYTGSGCLSSAIAMNKNLSKCLFKAHGIPVAEGISMKKTDRATAFADTGLSLPCIVKPCCGGSSVGVSVVRTEEEYESALAEAFRYEDEVILETYITGREFSVAVIDQKALPVIEIAPKQGFYDYQNKYKAGNTVETCPADLPSDLSAQMQQYAVTIAKAFGLSTYARMDFMLDSKNQIFCLETNTLPGMTPTSLLPQEAAAIGMSFPDLCEWLIEISMKNK